MGIKFFGNFTHGVVYLFFYFVDILKIFNPKLYGYSRSKKWFKSREAFNRAVSGQEVK